MTGFKSKRQMAQEDDDIQDYVRPCVGLTNEQQETMWAAIRATGYLTKGQVDEVMEVVESHLKEKNNG